MLRLNLLRETSIKFIEMCRKSGLTEYEVLYALSIIQQSLIEARVNNELDYGG